MNEASQLLALERLADTLDESAKLAARLKLYAVVARARSSREVVTAELFALRYRGPAKGQMRIDA